jgi:subtilisin family serine protease
VKRAVSFAFLFLMLAPLHARAEGSLFWEAGFEPAKYAPVAQGRRVIYPGAPMGGRAAPDAIPIALIDSGVSLKHPQLGGYVLDAVDFTGEGLDDVHGHGTALGLIAVFGGRDANFSILSAKVADRQGRVREKDVIEAIHWAVKRGARVVNLSLGFQGVRREYTALCDTIRYHWNVLFFASAGNFPRPTEVYPANCRQGNLHVTWVDPRTPRRDDLLID